MIGSIIMLLREGHAWFWVGYVNTRLAGLLSKFFFQFLYYF